MAARVASDSDYEAVMETIATAFHDDPLWSWIFPDPAARWDQQTRMFGFYVQSSLPRGTVLMADARASATIVYTPPGEPELTEDVERRIEPFLKDALGPHAGAALDTLERFRAAVPDGPPFYYVSLLGTRPDSRGGGIGMALLDEVCADADREAKARLPGVHESGQQPSIRAARLRGPNRVLDAGRSARGHDDVA